MLEKHPKADGNHWNGKEVKAMDPDQDAMDIIENGVRDFGCPFAWLLE